MYKIFKRGLDISVSLIALIILSPLLIPIVILLKLTGEGYVFYYQRRIGYKNKYFDIIKFATMLKNSPNIGTGSITLRNDPRLLPMGKFLRMTKINELPQILNVLKGEMSLVGPRPLVDRTFNAYPEDIRGRVYDSKPGITGIGSVVFRDEEAMISRSTLPPHEFYEKVIAPYKGALEIWYGEHKSMKVDLLIIFLTAWVVVFPNSAIVGKIFKDLPQPLALKA
ncbi:sugar transferase [Chitinophaga lutea]